MAIISAGVVMNLIFALGDGGRRHPCFGVQEQLPIGQVMPGEGAWRADLKPGDEILKVGGQPVVTFHDIWRPSPWATSRTASRCWCAAPARETPAHRGRGVAGRREAPHRRRFHPPR